MLLPKIIVAQWETSLVGGELGRASRLMQLKFGQPCCWGNLFEIFTDVGAQIAARNIPKLSRIAALPLASSLNAARAAKVLTDRN